MKTDNNINPEDMAIGRTSIILKEKHFDWIAKKGRKFNFSEWVRLKLDEEMLKDSPQSDNT